MVSVTKENGMFDQQMADMLLMKNPEQACAFYRGTLLFVFNFNPTQSLENVLIPVHQPGEYTVVLSSDDPKYGGFNNVKKQTYSTKKFDGKHRSASRHQRQRWDFSYFPQVCFRR